MSAAISYNTVRTARTNNTETVQIAAGGSFSQADVSAVYFLRRIEGTNTTIKDKDGNAIMVLDATHEWELGFRIDKGFTVDNGSLTVNDLEFFVVRGVYLQ